MRKRLFAVLAPLALLLPCQSCDWLEGIGEGNINLRFVAEQYVETKASAEVPDTNDFILTVTKSDGSVVYSGTYGASPESMLVGAGTYTVKVVSVEFSKPQFSAPQFGDEQCVVVKAGTVANVALLCRQLNSGMRLKIDQSFLTVYPKGLLYLKSDDGKLLYAYRETRIAYFKPGKVSLVLTDSGEDRVLTTKTLSAQEIYTLNVSASSSSSTASSSGGLSVKVDTTRNWQSDKYVIGGTAGGGSGSDDPDSAMSITDAKNNVGAEDVWVYGYIVGGDMSSSATGISFKAPFSSATHIAIAARSSVSAKSSCMSVQLSSGDIREALNLVDNPSNLGHQVYLKGDIVSSYYGVPGIKNITEFKLK